MDSMRIAEEVYLVGQEECKNHLRGRILLTKRINI